MFLHIRKIIIFGTSHNTSSGSRNLKKLNTVGKLRLFFPKDVIFAVSKTSRGINPHRSRSCIKILVIQISTRIRYRNN